MRRLRYTKVKIILTSLAIMLTTGMWAGHAVSSPSLTPIGNWSTVAAPLPVALANETADFYRDTLYVTGGQAANGNPVAATRLGSISPNASLTWTDGPTLPRPLLGQAAVVSDRNLLVIGGWDGSQRRQEILRTQIQSDGSLNPWQSAGTYPIPIVQADAVVVNGRLYVIGGSGATAILNTVRYATIYSNGELGDWSTASALPQRLYRQAAVAYNDTIYVTGGSLSPTQASAAVYFTRLNADGSLAGWQTAASLQSARFYHSAEIHDGRLVVLGGTTNNTTGINQVASAVINTNGTLGPWQTSEPVLPKPLYRFAATSVRKGDSDFIYVLGGLQGSMYQTAIYRSAVPPVRRYLPLVARRATSTPTQTPTVAPYGGDPFEPNDSINQAWGPLLSGQEYRPYIYGPQDQEDFYFLNIATARDVQAWLRQIPAGHDYNLYLYNSALMLIGYSGNLSNQDEQILAGILPAGQYYVRVRPVTGYSTTQPYVLSLVFPPTATLTNTPTATAMRTPTRTPTPTPTPVPANHRPRDRTPWDRPPMN